MFLLGESPYDQLPGTATGAVPHDNLIDVLVARLTANLQTLVGATYFGGFEDETAGDIAIVGDSVFITGGTSSDTLPGTEGAIQETKVAPQNTTSDAFLAHFDLTLTTLHQATFLGGPIHEAGTGLVVVDGIIYLGGNDDSPGFPGTGPGTGGAQEEFGGANDPNALQDGVIAAITADLQFFPAVTIDDVTLPEGTGANTVFEFTVSLSGPPPEEVTVDVQAVADTAGSPGDFLPFVPVTLTFTPQGASPRQCRCRSSATATPRGTSSSPSCSPTSRGRRSSRTESARAPSSTTMRCRWRRFRWHRRPRSRCWPALLALAGALALRR